MTDLIKLGLYSGVDDSDALTSIEALAATTKLKSILTNSKTATNSTHSLDPPKQAELRANTEANSGSSANFKKATSNNNNLYQNQPFKCLADSIDPRVLLGIIQERLESHKKVDINASTMATSNNNTSNNQTVLQTNGPMMGAADGVGAGLGLEDTLSNIAQAEVTSKPQLIASDNSNRVKCMPSARTINCQHHCVAILATRLFAILCNEHSFQQKLISESQEVCFNLIVDILYPNNDPVILLFNNKH